jgi:hypothetical protein
MVVGLAQAEDIRLTGTGGLGLIPHPNPSTTAAWSPVRGGGGTLREFDDASATVHRGRRVDLDGD